MPDTARDALARRLCEATDKHLRCSYPDCGCKQGSDQAGKQADAVLAWLAEPEQVERMAGALEDCSDDLPDGFTLRWLLKGKGAEHDGDCTKKPYSCLRCGYDQRTKEMRAAIAALKEPRT